MHELNFSCPQCRKAIELTLESEASVIVLSCVHCKAPLMYFHGEVFEVDEAEVQGLQGRQMKAVEGFLKVQGIAPQSQVAHKIRNAGSHKKGQPICDHAIGQEDITDLMIDLGTTEDVNDFLRKLER